MKQKKIMQNFNGCRKLKKNNNFQAILSNGMSRKLDFNKNEKKSIGRRSFIYVSDIFYKI